MTAYLTSVALIIAGCLAFYKLLLQKETFYRLNRFILMACLAAAFLLPLIPVPQQLSLRNAAPIQQMEQTRPRQPLVEPVQPSPTLSKKEPAKISQPISRERVFQWILYIYWFGVAIFGINFLIQLIVLLYRAYRSPVITDGQYRIAEIKGDKAPCSFGNTIFINPEKYDWDTFNQILQHEKVHIRQRHSFDLVFAELVLIIQWFNPFAWIYRKEIENNLEFLTDEVLVEKESVEKSSYQMSLLKVSTPQLPMHITTNYNQSLLKKRIAMMNIKKSNLHTTWKYFFLLPVFILFASLLNEPLATPEPGKKNHTTIAKQQLAEDPETEGYWFATIKGDQVNIQFRREEDQNNSYNGSSFKLSDFPNLPKGSSGSFTLTREAGMMEFIGKFEGNQGMGKYKFVPNKDYGSSMNKELNESLSDRDLMVFFFIDIKASYVKMLKEEGYKDLDKDQIIPLAALQIDLAFIRSLKESGLKGLTLDQMIPLKSLNIDKKYIQEIRNAGYQDISSDQLIAFKSQGIDGDYIKKLNKADGTDGNQKKTNDPDDLVALKALQIDDAYVNELKQAGYSNIDRSDLIAMKSTGINGAFIKSFEDIGYKNIQSSDLIPLKSLGITPEYVKGFQNLGYKTIDISDLIPMKSLGITEDYVKSFQSLGFKNVKIDDLIPLKSQNITPEYIKSFETAGFKDIPLHDFVALKSLGITTEYIKQMKDKGFNYTDVNKYITLKSLD